MGNKGCVSPTVQEQRRRERKGGEERVAFFPSKHGAHCMPMQSSGIKSQTLRCPHALSHRLRVSWPKLLHSLSSTHHRLSNDPWSMAEE